MEVSILANIELSLKKTQVLALKFEYDELRLIETMVHGIKCLMHSPFILPTTELPS